METEVIYIHQATLANLRQFLSEDKLHTLLCKFIEDSANLIQQLGGALATGNGEESRRLTHSLKSTSANVGALPLSEQAKQMEQFAREGQLEQLSTGLPNLQHCFALTQSAIESLEVMRKRKTG